MKKFLRVLGIVLIVIVAMSVVRVVFVSLMPQNQNISGLAFKRDTILPYCVKAATGGPNGITQADATKYCSCVYDTGVSTYGAERFTADLIKLGNENITTPELNTIINKCIVSLQ